LHKYQTILIVHKSITVLSCIAEALFEGVTLELEVAYFTDDCSAMTAAQRQEISAAFINTLRSHGVCTRQGTDLCDLADSKVLCGEEVDDEEGDYFGDWDFGFRKRRSTESVMFIRFKIKSMRSSTANCTTVCGNDITDECLERCRNTKTQEARSAVQTAAGRVENMFTSTRTVATSPPSSGPSLAKPAPSAPAQIPTITVSGKTLRPMTGVRRHAMTTECPSGMMRKEATQTCGGFACNTPPLSNIPQFSFPFQWNVPPALTCP
jgi:hypothetical protein